MKTIGWIDRFGIKTTNIKILKEKFESTNLASNEKIFKNKV